MSAAWPDIPYETSRLPSTIMVARGLPQHPVLVPSPLADGQDIAESRQRRHVGDFPGRIIDDQIHVDDGLCGQVRYGRGADLLDVQGDAWKRLRDQFLAGLKKDGPLR